MIRPENANRGMPAGLAKRLRKPNVAAERTERERATDDAEWWRQFAPAGWRLYGFSYRDTAAFMRGSERADVNGAWLEDLIRCGKVKL